MTRFQKILVCLDGSKYSEIALMNAVSIAEKFHSKIILLHVVEPAPIFDTINTSPFFGTTQPTSMGTFDVKNTIIKEERKGHNLLKRNSQILKKNQISHEVKILIGDPAKQILQFTKKIKPDIVFVGDRGKGKMSRIFLGSVSTSITQKANCSVHVGK